MTAGTSTQPEPGSRADVIRTWDARADRYLEVFRHELAGKPFDRAVLSGFAERVGAGGRVCDAGCGPCGHVAAFLSGKGLGVLGVDVSPRCIQLARLEQPGLRFEVLDFRGQILSAPGEPLDGIVAYYALHDQPRALIPGTFAAWALAVRPGGQLLVTAKEGTSDGVISDPLGSGMPVYWADFGADELGQAAESAGFRVDSCQVRGPYENEIPVRRIFLTATR
jgi:Methyltransferase domain